MNRLDFPIYFNFKIGTLSNDFVITNSFGTVIAFVRQKMFRFVEEVVVYADQSKAIVNYTIKANHWIDFGTGYRFLDANGKEFGKVVHTGIKSIWKISYDIFDESEQMIFHIAEENPWVRVFDYWLGEVPFLGIFTGYLFNPAYLITDNSGEIIARLKKQPSFWGRRFKLEKLGFTEDEERIMLGLMMMVLMERYSG